MDNVDTNGIIASVKKLSPDTELIFSPSGRTISVVGKDGTAKVWVGVTDGKVRLKYGEVVDQVQDLKAGVMSALSFVDSKYAEKEFKKSKDIAAEGDQPELECFKNTLSGLMNG